MTLPIESSAAVPLERRVHDAYDRARQRQGAMAIVDGTWRRLGAEISRVTNPPSGLPTRPADVNAARQHLLEKALVEFAWWADMPEAELAGALHRINHPPVAPTPPEQIAPEKMKDLQRRGVILIADMTGNLSAHPIEKLTEADKHTLTSLKPHFVAEVNRHTYIVP